MAGRKGGSVAGGMISRVVWAVIAGSVGMALFQSVQGTSAADVLENLRTKSEQLDDRYRQEIPKIVDNVVKGGGEGGGADPASGGTESLEQGETSPEPNTEGAPG